MKSRVGEMDGFVRGGKGLSLDLWTKGASMELQAWRPIILHVVLGLEPS